MKYLRKPRGRQYLLKKPGGAKKARTPVWVKPYCIFKFFTSFAEFSTVTWLLAYVMQDLPYWHSLHFHVM
jgi:hypothetical protein